MTVVTSLSVPDRGGPGGFRLNNCGGLVCDGIVTVSAVIEAVGILRGSGAGDFAPSSRSVVVLWPVAGHGHLACRYLRLGLGTGVEFT